MSENEIRKLLVTVEDPELQHELDEFRGMGGIMFIALKLVEKAEIWHKESERR